MFYHEDGSFEDPDTGELYFGLTHRLLELGPDDCCTVVRDRWRRDDGIPSIFD